MRNMKAILMGLGGMVAAGLLLVSGSAVACTNDVDCPNPACGGDVCQWGATHNCVPAGTDAQGQDGWCTVDTDCKCHGDGATCVGVHCSFTLPPAGTTGGTTGSSSTGGTGTGTTGGGTTTGASTTGGSTTGGGTTGGSTTGGSTTGGSTAGGSTTGAETSGGGTSGGSTTGGAYSTSSGCSTSGGGTGLVLGLGLLAGLALIRRRL